MGIRLSDGKDRELEHPVLTAVVTGLALGMISLAALVNDLADDRAEDRRLIAELIEAEVEQTAVLCETGALTGEGCEDENVR